MSKVISILTLLVLSVSTAEAQDPGKIWRPGNMDWMGDLDAALKKAKAEGKPVMIYVGSPICGSCRRFERDVLATKRFKAMSNSVIRVYVNWFGPKSDIRKKYQVSQSTTVVFLKPDGTVLNRYMPLPARGPDPHFESPRISYTFFLLEMAEVIKTHTRKKHQAVTPREFFKKFTSAIRSRDIETLWDIMSKSSQKASLKHCKRLIRRAVHHEGVRRKYQRDLGIDPTKVTPRKLARALLAYVYTHLITPQLVRGSVVTRVEKAGKWTIIAIQFSNGRVSRIYLVDEGGFLKIDASATGRANNKKRASA